MLRILKKACFAFLAAFIVYCNIPQFSYAWPNPNPVNNWTVDDLWWVSWYIVSWYISDPLLKDNKWSVDNFKLLDDVIEPIRERIDTTPIDTKLGWVDWVVVFAIDLFKTYIFPLTVILSILIFLFGFMEMMVSDSDDKSKKWADIMIYGVIGIIIFSSAEFIFNGLYSVITSITNAWSNEPSRNIYVLQIYNTIAYPFLKLAMYLMMAWLFILLLIKAIKYITDPSDKAAEQWRNIIISAAFGIVVITLAKTLVEAVFGKESEISWSWADTGWSIFLKWSLIKLDADTLSTFHMIINYFMWFIAFAILCIIIYQAYLMLFESNTDDSIKKMRKNVMYIFGGLILIWLSYLIVNLVALDI